MARRHQMTASRRAALKKAQAASARKRRGKGHTGRKHTKPASFRYHVGRGAVGGAAIGAGYGSLLGNPGAGAIGGSIGGVIGSTMRYRRQKSAYDKSRKKPRRKKR